jgi:cobaltochelatase CobN
VKLERSSVRITGFSVIPQENMTHPRIDVLLVPSGLYRDTFPYQIELMDTAVRMVAELNETNETNYVRWDSLKIEDAMLESGYNESVAHNISMSRIFSEAPGTYGTGMSEAVEASDTWDDESKLAALYISRMSNIYGLDEWGVNYEDVFTLNLEGVDTAMHSDTSNLYGLIDNDDYYSYMGGLALAVRSLTGETPDMYISDLTSTNPEIITLTEAFRTELRSRYFNSNWISGMMEYDYAGSREMMKFVEYMWGWDATDPDLVTDSDWNAIYDIYVNDKYDLGLDEFLKTDNPYQYQSITARMLETARKGYWDASDEVIQSLVSEYVESVVESGVTCCHHTCGNALLEEYIEGVMSVPGVVDEETAEKYKELMEEATESSELSSESSSHSSSNGHQTSVAEKLNQTSTNTEESASNQTVQDSDAGYGVDSPEPAPEARQSADPNYVEGYEMQKEPVEEKESGGMSFSGADILGTLFVIVAAGGIYMGFRKKKF